MTNSPVQALRHALPYLGHYRGKAFVVKLGGEAVAQPAALASLIEQVAILSALGIRVVVVHGGGPQTNGLSERLGLVPQFVDGRRVTDLEALDAAVMAINGQTQAAILAACRKQGLAAVGLSGIDAGLVDAVKRPPVKTSTGQTDFGLVGEICSINPAPIEMALSSGTVPVVSPISCDNQGQILNINADDVAARIATAVGAAKLVIVTTPRGILREVADPNSLITQITLDELDALQSDGTVRAGMLPKVSAVKTALRGGVERVHVVGLSFPDCLLTEVFTNEGCGTLILP
ncbi:MAG: acetylglutamate kinase [Armatimonadetes bacterium]|nr:acetylglutamate kinase [Armatimonadota bacterium]